MSVWHYSTGMPYRPGLHMGLTVLFGLGVVELEGADTCTCHQQEGDVLDVLNVLLVRVLDGVNVNIVFPTTESQSDVR